MELPAVGLGTYPLNKLKLIRVMFQAVTVGYRYIDTAAGYGNERWLGRALKWCPCRRNNLILSSKISNTQQRESSVAAAYERSCRALGVKFLDLYLIHWPLPGRFLETWKGMEELYHAGKVRAIGVCNFHRHHLEELLAVASVKPVLNQVELHPLLNQRELRDFCREQEILVEAYSPLARMNERLIGAPTLQKIAAKYEKSVPQVILRWDIQNGVAAVPKSSSRKRLRTNIGLFDFELTPEEMADVDALDCGLRIRYNPDNCDYEKL